MNRGFMMYEALIIFIIVSFIVLTTLNLNTTLVEDIRILENKIEKIISENHKKIKGCNQECLIKKALLQ